MFIRLTLALVLTILWLWPAGLHAQSEALQEASRQGMALYEAGQYEQALPFSRKALELGEKEFGPNNPTTATYLDFLALVYRELGRYTEAEPLIKRSLAIREKATGPDHPDFAARLNLLAGIYHAQGRYAEALPLSERALEITEKALGPESQDVAQRLNSLAGLYRAQGRYAEAEPLFQRSLAIYEKALGPEHPYVSISLNNLAELYQDQGRYAEAEPLYKRSLAIGEKAHGPEHPDVARSLNNLAELYRVQGRYAEAEPLNRRSLAIRESAFGPGHPAVAESLLNRANIHVEQGKYSEAESLFQRSLAIYEKAFGPDHPRVAININNLAWLYTEQSRYAEAEPLYKRSLAIFEKALGPEHPNVATGLSNLAEVYRPQGRYDMAEQLHKRALAIREKALGHEHPDVALSLNNLATLYIQQGRYAEAEPLYKRSLVIFEKALGPGHPRVSTNLDNLALLYTEQNRYAEAEPLYKRAMAINEKALGPDHSGSAFAINNLALLYHKQGKYAEAEPLLKRALTIFEKALGPEHPNVAQSLNNLAELYRRQSRYRDAETLVKRALAIREKSFGPEHPDVAGSLFVLAVLNQDRGRYADALDYIRRATNMHRDRADRAGTTRSTGARGEQTLVRNFFLRHADIAAKIIDRDPKQRSLLVAEAFEVGQLARATSAATAVARMGARFAAGDDDLARVVRDRQDAVERWRIVDARLVKAASESPEKRDAKEEAQLRSELAALDERIDALDVKLAAEFPEYTDLASPKPVPLVDVQSLLGPAEALVAYAVDINGTLLWVVRRDREAFHTLDIGSQELEDAVTALRGGLDLRGIQTLGDIKPFDSEEAFVLYDAILAPAEPLLDGVQHVFVVPDGALQSLPLGVLVTKEPKGRVRKLKDYAEVPWLAKRYAMTVLPSVSSLRALRRFAKTTKAAQPFAGFGDPLLEGDPGRGRGIDVAALFTRGAVADVDSVRKLPRLPDTADELRALAQSLGVEDNTVFLGERATETLVRSMDLSGYRILAFATHGLVAGEFSDVAEPALVFTPPESGTTEDDGLLTAGEIATLKLDADWVILSACNTAAADGTPGAEGLSGLAKAFFYAGARTLLVSHWSVNSDAAVKITSQMLAYSAELPWQGRAEALRQSMLALMADEEKPYYAHPTFWAPFVVVGEGGVPKG